MFPASAGKWYGVLSMSVKVDTYLDAGWVTMATENNNVMLPSDSDYQDTCVCYNMSSYPIVSKDILWDMHNYIHHFTFSTFNGACSNEMDILLNEQ